jgi:hypothetical protein
MEEYFSVRERGVELLRRCHEEGVNTVQFGRGTFDVLSAAEEDGFAPNWIATLYNDPKGQLGRGKFPPKEVEQELDEFESFALPLIGYQHFGESTDLAYFNGCLKSERDLISNLRERSENRLIGVCTHLPEVVRAIDENEVEWPIDFLQTSLHTVNSDRESRTIVRDNEVFEEKDCSEMLEAVRNTRYPCIVFKVLGSGRCCATPSKVRDPSTGVVDAEHVDRRGFRLGRCVSRVPAVRDP